MSIPAASQIAAVVEPNQKLPFVDPKTGLLTQNGWQTAESWFNFINGTCRIIPCNASGTNTITLTMLSVSPLIKGYADFDTYRAVAANGTTGPVQALVATPQGNLATINVYKSNGATQAGNADITAGLLYDFTFLDSLNSGAGGFVLR